MINVKGRKGLFLLSLCQTSLNLSLSQNSSFSSLHMASTSLSLTSLCLLVCRSGGVAVVCEFWLDLCWKIWVFLWIGFGILWVLV